MEQSFGPRITLPDSQIFFYSSLCFAFVNIKPVKPGHILVSPKRVCQRYSDLNDEELCDLARIVRKVGRMLERHHNSESLTIAIQDGPAAGQTIPHVHVHIIPRVQGDFVNNDEVYQEIDRNDLSTAGGETSSADADAKAIKMDWGHARVARALDEMAEEATIYRGLMRNME